MASYWTCVCGRRVPTTTAICSCGKTPDQALSARPPARITPSSAPEPRAFRKALRPWRALGLLAGCVGILYFGARAFNYQLISRATRPLGRQYLQHTIGPEQAERILERHHKTCVNEQYVPFLRRSEFRESLYLVCLSRAQAANTAPTGEVDAARSRAELPYSRSPTAPPAEGGRLFLSEGRVVYLVPGRPVEVRVEFDVRANLRTMGDPATCEYTIECNGRRDAKPTTKPCALTIERPDGGTGTLDFEIGEAMPDDGSCSMELVITRDAQY
jgi:hypothetical protein